VDPEVLIVDEIIAVGDEEFQRKCFDHLYELRRRGTTIVLVSHGLGIVADLCDDAPWLDQGLVRSIGPVRGVIDDYLAAVNQKEAEAEATSGAVSVNNHGGRSRRLGSGEIRITDVEFIDHNGGVAAFLTGGERCIVRLHYRAEQDLPSVTFGLSFSHESGVAVAGPNSGYGERAAPVSAGTGHVDFQIDDLILQPSTFLLSAAAVDRGHTYDFRDRAFELRVRAQGAVTEPGLVRLPGRWTRAEPISGSATDYSEGDGS
jgi:homopolymeric O-antigen transport system ATP-binding protein